MDLHLSLLEIFERKKEISLFVTWHKLNWIIIIIITFIWIFKFNIIIYGYYVWC
jgi:hypothetical protein